MQMEPSLELPDKFHEDVYFFREEQDRKLMLKYSLDQK